MRSANNNNNFYNVNNNGNNNNNNANNEGAVALGSSPARHSNRDRRNQSGGREGGHDHRESVNITLDRSGRTLLAWQSLVVMLCYMPGDLMPLYVITRQRYEGKGI